MDTFLAVFWAFAYLSIPMGIIVLCQRFKLFKKLGDVIVAYILGLILGHSGLLPDTLGPTQELLISLTIPLAIPLMLFGSDVKMWFRLAPQTIGALVTGIVALIVMVMSGYLLFANKGDVETAKVGGLFMGLYSGGTPNLAALQFVLKVKEEVYLAVNAYDMAVGSGYLFFLMTVGRNFFGLFMPKYKNGTPVDETLSSSSFNNEEPLWGLISPQRRIPLLVALGVAIVVFGVSAMAMLFVDEKYKMAVLVLSITTLGVLGSLNKRVRTTEKTFELGMYLILVFSLVIASKVNVLELKVLNPTLIYYMGYVVFGTLVLHALLAALIGVDRDTLMVCTTGLVCSPPFVPVVASAIGNRQVMVAGLTVGIIGYAVGNYLGILVFRLLLLL